MQSMPRSTFRGVIVAVVGLALAFGWAWPATAQAEPDVEWDVLAEGLNSPRGIFVDGAGTVYVAHAGTGGERCYEGPMEEYGGTEFCAGDTGVITRLQEGEATVVAEELPSVANEGSVIGPHDLASTGDGELFVAVGALGSPEELGRYGRVVRIDAEGGWSSVADVLAYEQEQNPGEEVIASDPYSMVASPAGDLIVSDAAMNTLLRVSPEGDVSILAELEGRPAELPPEMREEDGPEEIPMETVPTGLAMGPDGAYYVGELTGFPFPVGGARVWRVTPEGEAETYADGFTNIIDVAFDSSGRLYVLEMLSGGLLGMDPEVPETMQGALIRIDEDGTHTTIATERLSFPTGIAVGPEDEIYVSNRGAVPGAGELVRIALSEE